MLLSCLMADRTIEALRYFFNFLRTVSLRSNENRMDSSNLAVIFAPNLLHSNENEKMSANTEKKIRLQAAVVQTLIDHAVEIGQVPEFILEKIPAMLGADAFQSTPSLWGHEDSENESPSECKKRRHRSVGDIVSGALNKFKNNRTPSTTPQQDRSVLSSVTPVVLTPSTKRKLPIDCSQGLSSKKRRSFKHSFAFELLPNSIFNSSSTPASVQFEASPCVSLESSQTSLSPSTGGENHLSSTGNRRSKRLASKKLYRAESGKTGCFSPKISRKEMVRRSLRLKFGLGKSNREMNIVSGCAVGNRSENIGRRLASQQGLESRTECARRGVLFSPCVNEKFPKKGSKKISKSEENLLTPKCHNKVVYRMSWNSPTATGSQVISSNEGILPGNLETGIGFSEPVFIFGKPPVVPDAFKSTTVSKQDNSLELSLCEEESNSTAEMLLKVKQAFSASGSNHHNLIGDTKSSFSDVAGETLNETPCLTGLSPERESLTEEVSGSLANTKSRELVCQFNQSHAIDKQQSKKYEITGLEKRNFRTSIEIALQVQKPDVGNVTELPVPHVLAREEKLTVQNSSSKDYLNKPDSFRREEEIQLTHSQTAENCTVKCCNLEEDTAGLLPTLQVPESHNEVGNQYLQVENSDKTLTKTSTASDHGKVSDHIQWFNKLSLNDQSSASKTKPPLKFQRTPVRQSVRRINSLLEANRRSVSSQLVKASSVGSPLVKSLSYDSALFSCTEKPSKSSMALPLRSQSTYDQASISHKQLDLTSKSCCRTVNASDKPGVPVRTAGNHEQKATVHPSKSVLEDLTNHETLKSSLKVNANISIPGAAPEKSTITRSASGKVRYRGSPKNPISKVKLLPTAKPVDL
ncbi:rho GTPase-activating protein 11A [Antrostomus carolinensis]|uniref:rho GTPase-activating protein 11A n=1 Tax=Antrostomus carolinensis TaxID=279965 RepID=UPI00052853F5|nr:rho GTPase-activating protein 11A [Antrostomus carolinensis]